MAKASLASLSIDALLKLRDDIGDLLSKQGVEMQKQLARLTGSEGRASRVGRTGRGRKSKLKGRKVAPKYRHPKTKQTWSGRGAMAGWLKAEIKAGKKRQEFLIAKPAKVSKRKAKRSRKLKSSTPA
jgi:DNA-binding protein H-NS